MAHPKSLTKVATRIRRGLSLEPGSLSQWALFCLLPVVGMPLVFTVLIASISCAAAENAHPLGQDLPPGAVLPLPDTGKPFRTVAYSPDGRLIAVGGGDHKIRLYDAKTGKATAEISGHNGAINSVRFSPDGMQIASASRDSTVILWSVASREKVRVFAGHGDAVNVAVFSPDGTRLATASSDASIKLWDLKTGKELRSLTGHTAGIEGLDFSRDGRTILSEAGDVTARLWDAPTGRALRVLPSRDGTVAALAISPDARRGITTSDGHLWHVFDMRSGRDVMVLSGHERNGSCTAFTPDNCFVITGALDGTVRQWDLWSGLEVRRFGGYTGALKALAVDPTGRLVVAASANRILVWDIGSPPPIPEDDPMPAPTEEGIRAAWTRLASGRLAERTDGILTLLAGGAEAVAYLIEQLPVDKGNGGRSRRVADLIKKLDDDRFAVREDATTALKALGPEAGPALRDASESSSVEVRVRAAEILHTPAAAANGRVALALEILGWHKHPSAREHLEALSRGDRTVPLTLRAQAILARPRATAK